MKKLLIAGTILAVSALAIIMMRPDQQETIVMDEPMPTPTVTEATDIPDELVQIALDMGVPPDAAEEIAAFVEAVEVSTEANGGEIDEVAVNTLMADYIEKMVSIAESSFETDPAILPRSVIFERTQSTPADMAEGFYEDKWQEFISGMDLSDERAVQDIITEWEQSNLEVSRQMNAGEISGQQYADAKLTIDDLQDRLSPYLSRDQLVGIAVNDELYWENTRARLAERQRVLTETGYMSGIVSCRRRQRSSVRASACAIRRGRKHQHNRRQMDAIARGSLQWQRRDGPVSHRGGSGYQLGVIQPKKCIDGSSRERPRRDG